MHHVSGYTGVINSSSDLIAALFTSMELTADMLRQLITEELQDAMVEGRKKKKQAGPGNELHRGRTPKDKAGQFSSYNDSKSSSLHGSKHQMKSRKPAAPCGRGERRRCSDKTLKWESDSPPRSESSSDYRRDDPRYKNDRMRKAERFPGYDELQKLANGICEEVEATLDQLEEKKGGTKQCFNRKQMMALRQSIFNQIMGFINTYENVKKNTNPKPMKAHR